MKDKFKTRPEDTYVPVRLEMRKWGSLYFEYIPYGTIGWVKDKTNNQVRQCRCLGGKTMVYKDYGYSAYITMVYEWEVAGIEEHFFTDDDRIDIGGIHSTEAAAKLASVNDYPINRVAKRGADLYRVIVDAFGGKVSNKCFDHDCSVIGSGTLSMKCYFIKKDQSVDMCHCDWGLHVDENGIAFDAKDFRETNTYTTEMAAKEKIFASAPKTITFDSAATTKKSAEDKVIKVTVEIKESDLAKIKDVCKIV